MIDGLRIGADFQPRSCQPEVAANKELAGQLLCFVFETSKKPVFSDA